MRPTEVLSAEHRVIEQVLGSLEVLAKEAGQTQRLDRDMASKAVQFLRLFADKCHHAKEEGHLFKKLVEKGMPANVGPVGVMLAEHEMGRALIRRMDKAAADWQDGSAEILSEFIGVAREYVSLLRAHIMKEDNILFPMAAGMLSDIEQDALLEAFYKTEHVDMPAGVHEDMVAIAEVLVVRYKVAATVPAQAGHACGCNCH